MNEAPNSPIDAFLKEIEDRKNDLGFLAELRRGLSPTTRERCWPHIIRFTGYSFENENRRNIWCAIGGLAALLIPRGLSTDDEKDNLGSTMQRLAIKSFSNGTTLRADKEKALKNFSTRLRRLLDESDTDSLCEMTIRIVRMAFNKEVSVNLRNLFLNLCGWDKLDSREKTRLKWAQSYYRVYESRVDVVSPKEGECE